MLVAGVTTAPHVCQRAGLAPSTIEASGVDPAAPDE